VWVPLTPFIVARLDVLGFGMIVEDDSGRHCAFVCANTEYMPLEIVILQVWTGSAVHKLYGPIVILRSNPVRASPAV
jgi:hypothetical protein